MNNFKYKCYRKFWKTEDIQKRIQNTQRDIYYCCEISRKKERIVSKRIFDQESVLGVLPLVFEIMHCSHYLQEQERFLKLIFENVLFQIDCRMF